MIIHSGSYLINPSFLLIIDNKLCLSNYNGNIKSMLVVEGHSVERGIRLMNHFGTLVNYHPTFLVTSD